MNEKQMDRLDSEAREQRAASEIAPCETAGPAKVVAAVAGGSPAVPSAYVRWIATVLHEQAEMRREAAKGWIGCTLSEIATCKNAARGFSFCAEILRRHAESMDERQPQENIVVSHTGALSDSTISNQVPRPGVGL